MKKIDDYLHAACSTVTFAVVFRKGMLRLKTEELEAHLQRIPDAAYRERQRLSIEHGLDAPHVAPALKKYDQFIAEMESALAAHPYLAGPAYSLADIAATPYINRAAMLGMEPLWAERPKVADWFQRMRSRPSFEPAVTRWLTQTDIDRFSAREDIGPRLHALLR